MIVSNVIGDVARFSADVVVNAANPTLLGGGGVDGAIHRGAGPELLAACRLFPESSPGVRCLTGEARLTPGFGLRARQVAHTVGPIHSRHADPDAVLARSLRSALGLAVAAGARTVAVPALSCGAYGFPVQDAAPVLVGVARERAWALDRVDFVLFDVRTHRAFEAALARAPRPSTAPDPAAFRRAERRDDAAIAAIIREVMTSFGASGEGFAIHDPEVDGMSAAYSAPRSAYLVVEDEAGNVIGGAGVAPLAGGDAATCELRKMYFRPEARGKGLGERALRQCLTLAKGYGFAACYLETLTGMDAAMRLYERAGFVRTQARGATGHHGCDRHYALDLAALDLPAAPG